MRSLAHLLVLLFLLLPVRAHAQVYDARGLEAAVELRLRSAAWQESVRPVPVAQNEPAKIWMIGGAAAVVVGAVVGGGGGTILIVGGIGCAGYGFYLATR